MILFNLLVIISLVYAINAEYCVSAYCQQLNRNIPKHCYNEMPIPTVAKTCPGDAQIQKLSPADQELFVKLHNTYRSRLANGSIQKFSPASKMREVSWDHQLAFLAAINVAQCQMNHDNCRATQNAVQPGQNLYMGMKTGSFYTNSEVIKNSVDVWFNEFVYASQSDLTHCCGPNNNFHKIGHFTQMMKDDVDRIGCAVVKFTKSNVWKTSGIACEYSKMQMIGEPIYHSGPTASQCPAGRSENYQGLCK